MVRFAHVPLVLVAVLAAPVIAAEADIRTNYMLHCQGCHTPDGRGAAGKVPSLKDFMGNFLRVEGGREFLIRVPGAAQSALSDGDLADLTNWMLLNFSAGQTPANFRYYDAEEVGRLRADLLVDVSAARTELVGRMSQQGIAVFPLN